MVHTKVEGNISDPPENLARGFFPLEIFSKTFFLKLPHWNYSLIQGAGGIVSNIADLDLWNRALWNRQILDPQWAASYFPTKSGEENYNFGWFQSDSSVDGIQFQTLNHGGEDPGYCSMINRIPQSQAHIIITLNSDGCFFRDDVLKPLTPAGFFAHHEPGKSIKAKLVQVLLFGAFHGRGFIVAVTVILKKQIAFLASRKDE